MKSHTFVLFCLGLLSTVLSYFLATANYGRNDFHFSIVTMVCRAFFTRDFINFVQRQWYVLPGIPWEEGTLNI